MNKILRSNDTLSFTETDIESCFIEIDDHGSKILVGSIYRPPNSNINRFLTRYKEISKILKKFKGHCLIGMDHNLDFLKAGKHDTTQSFVDLNLEVGLFPTITRPTRITHTSATLIDNIMISKDLYDAHCIGILLSDLSDHLPCLLTISNTKKSKQEPMYRTICDTSDKALKCLNNDLKGINWNIALDNVDELFNDFHSKVQQQIEKHCPEKSIRLSPKSIRKEPWLTKGIINSSKKQ